MNGQVYDTLQTFENLNIERHNGHTSFGGTPGNMVPNGSIMSESIENTISSKEYEGSQYSYNVETEDTPAFNDTQYGGPVELELLNLAYRYHFQIMT